MAQLERAYHNSFFLCRSCATLADKLVLIFIVLRCSKKLCFINRAEIVLLASLGIADAELMSAGDENFLVRATLDGVVFVERFLWELYA